mmetsp:Transcript_100456/g.324189  ORF Transcript_100456/g.324189 Transcript_100456/m.324189 type:complete len:266 (+) Transcript_100456:94-891(+)
MQTQPGVARRPRACLAQPLFSSHLEDTGLALQMTLCMRPIQSPGALACPEWLTCERPKAYWPCAPSDVEEAPLCLHCAAAWRPPGGLQPPWKGRCHECMQASNRAGVVTSIPQLSSASGRCARQHGNTKQLCWLTSFTAGPCRLSPWLPKPKVPAQLLPASRGSDGSLPRATRALRGSNYAVRRRLASSASRPRPRPMHRPEAPRHPSVGHLPRLRQLLLPLRARRAPWLGPTCVASPAPRLEPTAPWPLIWAPWRSVLLGMPGA